MPTNLLFQTESSFPQTAYAKFFPYPIKKSNWQGTEPQPLWGRNFLSKRGPFSNAHSFYYGRDAHGYPTCTIRMGTTGDPGDLKTGEAQVPFNKLDELLKLEPDSKTVTTAKNILAKYGHDLFCHAMNFDMINNSGFKGGAEGLVRIMEFGLWPRHGNKIPWYSSLNFNSGAIGAGLSAGAFFQGLATIFKKDSQIDTNQYGESIVPPDQLMMLVPSEEIKRLLIETLRKNADTIFYPKNSFEFESTGLPHDFLESRILSITDLGFEDKLVQFIYAESNTSVTSISNQTNFF